MFDTRPWTSTFPSDTPSLVSNVMSEFLICTVIGTITVSFVTFT